MPPVARPMPEKLARWSRPQEGGCVIWIGQLDKDGFGRVSAGHGSKKVRAHRASYECSIGPIPPDADVYQTCRQRACIGPQHLEAVTRKVSTLRGNSPAALHARKTHCPAGHPYNEENTRRRKSGARVCRTCHAEGCHLAYLKRNART